MYKGWGGFSVANSRIVLLKGPFFCQTSWDRSSCVVMMHHYLSGQPTHFLRISHQNRSWATLSDSCYAHEIHPTNKQRKKCNNQIKDNYRDCRDRRSVCPMMQREDESCILFPISQFPAKNSLSEPRTLWGNPTWDQPPPTTYFPQFSTDQLPPLGSFRQDQPVYLQSYENYA